MLAKPAAKAPIAKKPAVKAPVAKKAAVKGEGTRRCQEGCVQKGRQVGTSVFWGSASASSAPPHNGDMSDAHAPSKQPRNPLHGVTLEAMVTQLAAEYGWPGLADRIALRCFSSEPSVASSLKFLRRTPWAREKVEGLYLFMLRDQRRRHED